MVSNDPWSPLAGGQDSSTVLGGNDAWGEPAAAVTGIVLKNIKKSFRINLLFRKYESNSHLEKKLCENLSCVSSSNFNVSK